MRIDHWVKNLFVLPGVVVALSVESEQVRLGLLPDLIAGMLSVGLVSSSNYVINELLDGPYDLQHPIKSQRPVPRGDVHPRLAWVQWLVLMIAGVAVGLLVSLPFAAAVLALWVFGTLYNVEPFRTKDMPYVDVLTEAINNPIRLIAGWSMTETPLAQIPISLVLSYWMIGCYFMAIKRYAELRHAGSVMEPSRYRQTFATYTEGRLMTTVVFYASAAMLFVGAFTIRHRIELVLSFPFIAAVMGYYLTLAFRPDSAVQAPETLYREQVLVALVLACAAVMTALLFVDVPELRRIVGQPGG